MNNTHFWDVLRCCAKTTRRKGFTQKGVGEIVIPLSGVTRNENVLGHACTEHVRNNSKNIIEYLFKLFQLHIF